MKAFKAKKNDNNFQYFKNSLQILSSKNIFVLGLIFFSVFVNQTVAAASWITPKTEFGDPDLQGTWSSATITSLERVAEYGEKLIVSEEEAKAIEDGSSLNTSRKADAKASDPNAGVFTDGDAGAGYNAFWLDPGNRLMRVNGEIRTSIITDPQNGKIPYTPQGNAAFFKYIGSLSTDGPEQRPLGERCMVGFGSSGGPPMLPVLYNNHYEIAQSPGYVMVMAEMNHDARIIRIDGKHSNSVIKPWLGDSVGHWEGNTLVVETKNFHPQQSVRLAVKHQLYVPADATVIEKFTRVSDAEIVYGFEIQHSGAYTQTWKGELAMNKTEENIFEYACHEGNYAMPGILAGARMEEKKKAAK